MSLTKQYIIDAFKRCKEHPVFKDVKINMKFCYKKKLYDKGYKYCNNCSYMVNTDIYLCPVCGRIFKTHLLNKEHDRTIKPFSEPYIKLGIINDDSLVKGVVSK